MKQKKIIEKYKGRERFLNFWWGIALDAFVSAIKIVFTGKEVFYCIEDWEDGEEREAN